MTEQELKKMGRSDLVELLLILSRENVQLRSELEAAQNQLTERNLQIEKAGSLAEASLALNGVFTAAQAAAEQYLENIRLRQEEHLKTCQKIEEETKERCTRLQTLARQMADTHLRKVKEQADNADKNG